MKIESFLSESPMYAFYLANHLVFEPFQNKLKLSQVHFLQGLILTSILFEKKPIRPKEMVRVFHVSPSGLSHSLRGLEKKGFLLREMHEEDARGYCFSLTPSGKRKALSLIKEFDEVQQRLEESIGIKNLKNIVSGIQQVVSAFEI